MDADNNGLYLLQSPDVAIPINLRAFTVAQGSKREITRKNIGCMLITRDGQARQVLQIMFLGLYGDNYLRKVLSLFTSVYKIETQFKPVVVRLDELKIIVARSIVADAKRGDRYFCNSVDPDTMLSGIKDARSIDELFNALHIDDEEQLDVLS